ncbi:MAG: N4-gp56 family major capsid protein [Endomicrobium sp.]|nr:N4-gp56 family major capsid protein [Endomicrobium sp.]
MAVEVKKYTRNNKMAYTGTGDLSPKGLDSADNSSVALQGFIKKLQPDFDKKFLLGIKPHLQYHQHGQKGVLLRNQGNIVKFVGYKPLPSHDLKRQKLETCEYEIEATPKRYYDIVPFSHVEEPIASESAIRQNIETAGQQAAESIERLVRKEVGNGLLHRRADNNQDYQKDLAINASSLNSTTVIQNDAFTDPSIWIGARITFLSQNDPSYGQTVNVTGYSATNKTVTFAPALAKVPAEDTAYRIVSCRDLLTVLEAGKLTPTVLELAVSDLENSLARPMNDGNWVCIIDPYMEYDFYDFMKNNGAWTYVSEYHDQDKKNIYNGEIGKWRNIRFVVASKVYKETIDGAYTDDDDNSVHFATLLGQDAYGVVELEEGQGKKIYIRNWDQLGQPLPLRSTIAWDIMFTTKILNATFGVNIACAVSN